MQRLDKAVNLFRETHPFFIECGLIPHHMRTAEQKQKVMPYSNDCDCYRTTLFCLLALIVAKQPLTTDDLIDLCVFAGIQTHSFVELENRDSRSNYRVINHAFITLTVLGFAQTLCVTNTDIKPELHNRQFKEFRAFSKDMTAVAKV